MRALVRWTLRTRPFPYDKRTAAHALALLYLVGGLTTLLLVVLPHPAGMWDPAMVIIGCTSPLVAVAIRLLRDRLATWAYPWLLVAGTGIVTVLVAAGGGGPASVSLSFFYTWVVIYALLFFRPLIAALQVLAVAVAYASVLTGMGSFASGTFTTVEPVVLTAVIATTGAVVLLLSHARENSELDPLTGIANRRGLDRVLEHTIGQPHTDGGQPSVLAILDVDHFKQINDRQGHHAGDRVLQQLVEQWRSVLRADDTIARFGGDEFVVVLPVCALSDAAAILERLRDAAPDVTCSIGSTDVRPGDSASLLLSRADAALYQAKRLGRNQLAWAA